MTQCGMVDYIITDAALKLASAIEAAERERQALYVHSCHAACTRSGCVNARLRAGLTELRDRIKGHPAYADLTPEEECDVGGDTAELSYLARVADEALGG